MTILQLAPGGSFLDAELALRGKVVRWYDLPDQKAWHAAHGHEVRIVTTGGHLGIPTQLMRSLPRLGLVAINGVGFDRVYIAAARAQGVQVSNTPDVLTDDVADLAIGLLIALLRRIPQSDTYLRAGRWPEAPMPVARKASGRRYGILGMGRIGKAVASRLVPFGGEISYFDLASQALPYAFRPDPIGLAAGCNTLFVTAAASAATRGLVGEAMLEALGPDGVLVNVARGSIVHEEALIAALAGGRIFGAALDVFADEPRVPEALRVFPNVVLTPHIASATVETRGAMARLMLANIDCYLAEMPLPTAVA